MFSNQLTANLSSLSEQYHKAQPFPHLVIDQFFQPEIASQLLADFPEFDEDLAKNERGRVGPKAVNSKMRAVSPFYDQFCDFLLSPEFIQTIEQITGIDELISLPDETGGTHESRNGATLAPHIDYNYFGDAPALHRRLNVLFYLNERWDASWGGNLELHSNPRNWAENTSVSNAPLFNRCIIMETSERSWHGYDPIHIPVELDISRKSISIYLFSRSRPENEIAPRHATFYVQPPLPDIYRSGLTLEPRHVQEIRNNINKRDMWINFYQEEVLKHSRRAEKEHKKAAWLMKGLTQARAQLEQGDPVAAAKALKGVSISQAHQPASNRLIDRFIAAAKILRGPN